MLSAITIKAEEKVEEITLIIMGCHVPDAERIILVMDNLNTHKPASLYKRYKPDEAGYNGGDDPLYTYKVNLVLENMEVHTLEKSN